MTNALLAIQALGDSSRRELFERLVKGPLAVVDLAEGLPISRSAVSQHLKVLKNAGLVIAFHKGTRNFYQVDPKGVDAMRHYLDRLWDKSLFSFKQLAERENKKTTLKGKPL